MPHLCRPARYLILFFCLAFIGWVIYPSPSLPPIPPGICSEADYFTRSSVPRLIHQNYFAPLNSPDERFKKLNPNSHIGEFASRQSFQWQRSSFGYRFYSESAAKTLLHSLKDALPKDAEFQVEDYIRTWESLPRIILRADFWRYIVLYLYGGIYTDTDVELESPLPWQVLCDDTAWPGLNQEGDKLGLPMLEGKMEPRSIDDMRRSNQTKLFVGIEDSHTTDGGSAVTRPVQLLTWYDQTHFQLSEV